MSKYICKEEVAALVKESQKKATYDISIIVGDTLLQIIDMCPTADVVPVVHGHWLYHYNRFNYIGICSNCGKQTAFCKTLDGAPHGYPHCPYCTAKMDESEDNDNE